MRRVNRLRSHTSRPKRIADEKVYDARRRAKVAIIG